MKTDKRRRFIINFIYFAIIALIVYVLFKHVIFAFMPFVVAFIISAILEPIISFFVKRFKMKRKFASAATVTLFLGTVGVLIVMGLIGIFNFTMSRIQNLPTYYTETLLPMIENVLMNVQVAINKILPDVTLSIQSVMASLTGKVSDLTSVVKTVTAVAGELPSLFLSVLITIISTYFISSDFGYLGKWCLHQLPEKTKNTVCEIKMYITKILFKYIRSYALILLITFTELFIAFSVISFIFDDMFSGVLNIALTASLIAVFDILPIVGTGTILVPWAIIMIIVGSYPKAIALILIYGIILVVRNVIEPKIIGQQVGLHPIVTLMGMVIGTTLFGIIGLFGVPMTFALLKDLDDRGKIHLIKHLGKKEAEKIDNKP